MLLNRSRPRRLTALLAATALAAAPLLATPTAGATTARTAAVGDQAGDGRPGPQPFKVMTRNLYLGADIMRPIRAVQGLTDQLQILTALGNAAYETREIVEQTNFRVRSRLLAREIAAKKPDLVGLQEVAMWRSGPMDIDPALITVPNAETVDYDFLRMLLRKLRHEGVRYRAVNVNWLSDVEAPAFEGALGGPGFADARDVRLTMRDVILKRVGNGMRVVKEGQRQFENGLTVDIAGRSMDFARGYHWVDVVRDGDRMRFINTHLEAFSSDMAYAQAQEMLAGPGDYGGTTVIACDCNSDPLNHSVKTDIGDTLPHSAPYELITEGAGFHDAWLQWRPAEQGWTSGLSETVDDETAAGFDHRIDIIFARRGDGRRLRVDRGTVTGDSVRNRDDATGLWPSDHAGVQIRFRRLP